MSTAAAYSGSVSLAVLLQAAFSGDTEGGRRVRETLSHLYAAAGGDAPTISGFLAGTISMTGAGSADILLAHATDPLQTLGNAAYSDGFTVAGSKLKELIIVPTGGTLTVARKTTNGLPIFSTADDALVIGTDGIFHWYDPAGTAALTTGSNDGITLTSSATLTALIIAIYGP